MALEKLASDVQDEMKKNRLNFFKESLTLSMDAPEISTETLKRYAGEYGERKVYYENGKLYYQRGKRQIHELTPIADDTFMLMEVDYFRVKFDRDAAGNITGITGIYDNGNTDSTPKTN